MESAIWLSKHFAVGEGTQLETKTGMLRHSGVAVMVVKSAGLVLEQSIHLLG